MKRLNKGINVFLSKKPLDFFAFLGILSESKKEYVMQIFAAEFISTFFWFVVVLSFIVFVHELGHFLPARCFGIKVETFSIGFGRELFGWNDSKGTRWKFSWIPLGGYVKFFGDVNAASAGVDKNMAAVDQKDSLYYRSVWQRIVVSFGGPAANYLLAIVLFFVAFFITGQPGLSSKIESFSEDSPAKAAGILVGDEILSINEYSVSTIKDIFDAMSLLKTPDVTVKLKRQGAEYSYVFSAHTLKGAEKERYILGIQTANGEAFQFVDSISKAAVYPFQISWATLVALKNMILCSTVEGLGGPVAIAKGIKAAADMGFIVVLFYAALISTSLGFFNLLPIPTLDGGHLLFYFIEALRGRPVSEKIQEWAFTIGFVVLIALFVFVTYKDIFLK